MRHLVLIVGILLWTMAGCDVQPVPIEYNQDECAFCKMKISDVRFGAELVTQKGKIYKYDSAECLVRTFLENADQDYAHVMVTDFSKPKLLINGRQATYLISENQASPMGGNLSAYELRKDAQGVLDLKGGQILTFEELVDTYKKAK